MASDAPKTDLQFLEQFEPEVFWEEHGPKIMAGLLAVILVGLGIYLWQKHSAEQALAASIQLAAAQDVPSLENVISQYHQLPAGTLARLKLGDVHFRQGRYEEAGRQYQAFLEQHPGHALAPLAQLGIAAVTEAGGDLSGARAQYERLSSQSTDGFIRASAKLGAARCTEMQGDFKTARQLYEEVMAAGQRTPLSNEAMMRWTILGRQVEAVPAEPSPALNLPPASP